jgi:hypothetical protein
MSILKSRRSLCLALLVLAILNAGSVRLSSGNDEQRQSTDSQPDALSKERKALYLKAIHTPLADLEADLNQLAVASESCRAEHGAKTCGLPDKALASDKLEERYDYYVKHPVESRLSGHGVRVEKRNWERPGSTASK